MTAFDRAAVLRRVPQVPPRAEDARLDCATRLSHTELVGATTMLNDANYHNVGLAELYPARRRPGPTLHERVRAATSHQPGKFIKNVVDMACLPWNCKRIRTGAMRLRVVGA